MKENHLNIYSKMWQLILNMDFISILKARRDAANECIGSSVVT